MTLYLIENYTFPIVIPAKAGIQVPLARNSIKLNYISSNFALLSAYSRFSLSLA